MTHSNENYKGFNIQKRTDVKTHTCIIYKSGKIIKCISGDIFSDGSENSIEKAKKFINQN
jgi:hypothetical protein